MKKMQHLFEYNIATPKNMQVHLKQLFSVLHCQHSTTDTPSGAV